MPGFGAYRHRDTGQQNRSRKALRPVPGESSRPLYHFHLPSDNKNPTNLDEFPHNLFGQRLRVLGEQLEHIGENRNLATRLIRVAHEDSNGDGVPNETELLLGHNPGNADDAARRS